MLSKTKETYILLFSEDLKHRGFKMIDRKLGLTVVQCSAILKELAKFHALSLAMKVLQFH